MTKVTLRGHICVPEQPLRAVKTALEAHTRLTRAEPACIVFDGSRRSGGSVKSDKT